MKIPFGKPFPGIDTTSLRDGVAAGLVNGFINELKDYEKIPGLTLFGGYPTPDAPPDPEPEPEPEPEPARGLARRFNGIADNLKNIGSSNSTFFEFTLLCHAKREYLGTRNALSGRVYAIGNGWCVFVDEDDLLTLRHDSTEDQVPCPDLTDWTALAVTHVGSGASGITKFYAGPTAETMQLIGTVNSPAGGFSELGIGPMYVGWCANAQEIDVAAWNGSLDHYRLWAKVLTLEEIQAQAVCESPIIWHPFLKLALDIVGQDPEPADYDSNPDSFLAVNGTTVVEGIICG